MNSQRKWAFGVLLVAALACCIATKNGSADEPSGKASEVANAQKAISVWLGWFKDKNGDEVKKALGPDPSESKWKFQESEQLLWKYKVNDAEMSLYFYKGKVVKASLHMMSEK